jgi:hypothetical protein
MVQTMARTPHPEDGLGAGDAHEVVLGAGVARRLLFSLDSQGIDASNIQFVLRLHRVVIRAYADAGDVAGFEEGADALRQQLRRARSEAWLAGKARSDAEHDCRAAIAQGVVSLCTHGRMPRFGIVRAALSYTLRMEARRADGVAHAEPVLGVALLPRVAAAQCVAAASRRRARALARVLRKHLERLPIITDQPSIQHDAGSLLVEQLACLTSLSERFGPGDRAVARALAVAGCRMLPWSAATAAEAADAVLAARNPVAPADARGLAHAVASEAWLALGDPGEALRHADACRRIPLRRLAARWDGVPFASETIGRVRRGIGPGG